MICDHSTAPCALSFVVCVSDRAALEANLLASPCLGPGSPHEVITVGHAPDAASGLNPGLERAEHDLVVCVHQDVSLPASWDRQIVEQYRQAEERFGPIGVAGVYGVGPVLDGDGNRLAAQRVGRVVDRGRVLDEGVGLPAPVATLDELVLLVRRGTPLRFDSEMGFHLYDAGLCLQARERGLAVVALEAPCIHNSRSVGLPWAFFESADDFARKWRHRLPVATPCAVLDSEGRVFVLGDAEPGGSGLARAVGEAIAEPIADECSKAGPRWVSPAPQMLSDRAVQGPRASTGHHCRVRRLIHFTPPAGLTAAYARR